MPAVCTSRDASKSRAASKAPFARINRGRDNAKPVAVARLYNCLLDACPVRRHDKARAVRVEQHPHIRCRRESIAITPAKVGWAAEALDASGGEVCRREVSQQRAHAAWHGTFRVVDAVPRLAHGIRTRIMRGQLLVGYGPTAVGDPGAMLELYKSNGTQRPPQMVVEPPNRRCRYLSGGLCSKGSATSPS